MRKIFLATRNEGKVQRFKKLLRHAGLKIALCTPKDLGLENIEVEENGKDLRENAEIKARAYFGKVRMPILANDTGFWVKDEGFVDAPKRKALSEKLGAAAGSATEEKLTNEKIAKVMLDFWQRIASKHGGKVDAAWVEAFVLLDSNGTIHTAESRREVVLTNEIFGEAHGQLPMRALYISKATGKPAVRHTKEEEMLELEPITEALRRVLTNSR